jgi:hypothetical protein
MVVNCFNTSTFYNVTFFLTNPNSYLDFRFDGYPLLYGVLCVVHLILALSWGTNLIRHPEFSIDLAVVLAMMPAIRSVEKGLQAVRWSNAQQNKMTPVLQASAELVLRAIYFSLAFVTTALIIGGWCIFRSNLNKLDIFEVIAVSTVTTVTLAVFGKFKTLEGAMAGGTIICAGIFWYARIVFNYLIVFIDMVQSTNRTGAFWLRLDLVLDYLKAMLMLFLAAMFGGVAGSIIKIWPVAENCVFESILLGLHATHIWLFFLGGRFQGDEVGPLLSPTPHLLDAPEKVDIVFLTREQQA